LKQYNNETNDARLTRFKSTVYTLIIAGGKYILVSELMMGCKFEDANKEEENKEIDRSKAVWYVLRSDKTRYKKLLNDLKSSANRGRDDYPKTLTSAFDLLVNFIGVAMAMDADVVEEVNITSYL